MMFGAGEVVYSGFSGQADLCGQKQPYECRESETKEEG